MKKRILIVDDEIQLVRLLENRLKEAGYDVSSAQDGTSGWETAKRCRPDLILLDIVMPGMDGTELGARLRDDASTKHIPIIFVTSLKTRKDEALMPKHPVNRIFSKPLDSKRLLSEIETLVKS